MLGHSDQRPDQCPRCGFALASDQFAAQAEAPDDSTLVGAVDAAVRSRSAVPITLVTFCLLVTGTAVVLGQRSMTGGIVGGLCLLLVAIAWKHRLSRPRT